MLRSLPSSLSSFAGGNGGWIRRQRRCLVSVESVPCAKSRARPTLHFPPIFHPPFHRRPILLRGMRSAALPPPFLGLVREGDHHHCLEVSFLGGRLWWGGGDIASYLAAETSGVCGTGRITLAIIIRRTPPPPPPPPRHAARDELRVGGGRRGCNASSFSTPPP